MEIVCKVAYNRSPELKLKTAPETFLKAAIQGRRMGHKAEPWYLPLRKKARKSLSKATKSFAILLRWFVEQKSDFKIM